ncbi:TadG family pilus assembly protein [Methylopila sp. M107]|uniref:TadG family pilus assembly protein n=1 Tax=Methylopila sp. M107 TaxID=1101190 RepID=UPI00035CA169|nr:TadG family pilus assembly protein [Methylopila sp. M107]
MLRGGLRRFGRDQQGVVSIIVAAFGVGLVASLAIAIDVSNVYLQRRHQQSALDLAAIAAARDIGRAETVARTLLAANGVADPGDLKVTLGRYEADRGKDSTSRFVADAASPNAVRLVMTKPAPLYFGRALLGGALPSIRTRSVAANTRFASFTIGTRLASLNGGIANALLSKLLGAEVSLNVMDYDALAAANVDMPDLLNALAPRLGVTVATYDDVLALNPTLGQLAEALRDAASSNATAKLALGRIILAKPTKRLDLRRLLSFGPLGKLLLGQDTRLSAKVAVLDVLFAGLGVANGSSQIDLNLGAQIPGVLGLTASLTIGERPQSSPWLAMGPEGVSVSTAQTRLRLLASVGGPLGLPAVRLPIAVDVAAGTAKLAAARCGANPRTDAQATLQVVPTLAEIWVGEPVKVADWNALSIRPEMAPAVLLDTLLLTATASAHVAATNLQPRSVTFSASEIDARKAKLVSTGNIAESTLTSLVGGLSVEVRLLGLTLGTPQALSAALAAVVRPLGALLDPVLNDVLKLLGVGVGEAEVTVGGLRCDGSALVM